MKVGALIVLGGAVCIAGCGSSSAPHPAAKASPTSRSVAARQTTTPDVPPTPTAAVRTPVPVPASAAPFAKARVYMLARDYQQAVQQFQLAIQRRQHVPESYAGIGTADLALQKYAGSYRAYRAAARLQPANPAYLYYAAYSALYAQDFHGSVTYATRFLRLRPASPEGYHLRFLAYGQLLNRHKQLLDAQTYVRLRPKSPDAQNDLGIALANNAKYVPAVQAFSRAIQLKPSFAQYYIERATVENLNHQPTLVLRDLEKARSLAGNTAEAQQLDQAISQYKKQMNH